MFGYCDEDDFKCIVLEYIANKTLDYHLKKEESLTEFYCERINVLKGVAEVLLHLHEHEIAHEDIKPANILVTADMSPKLAGFGLAWVVDEPSGAGTIGHMNPFNIIDMYVDCMDPLVFGSRMAELMALLISMGIWCT